MPLPVVRRRQGNLEGRTEQDRARRACLFGFVCIFEGTISRYEYARQGGGEAEEGKSACK